MAFALSGGNQGMTRTASLLDYNSAYSVGLWFYKTTSATDVLFSSHVGSQDSDQLRITSAELWQVRANIGGVGGEADDGFNITLNTWYYAGMVRSSVTDITAYLFDATGAEVSSPTRTTDITGRTAQTATSVGHRGLTNDFTGYIHCIKMWTAALTPTDLVREMWRVRPQLFANLHSWSPTVNATVAERDLFAGLDWTFDGTPTNIAPPPISWGMPQSQISAPTAAGTAAMPGALRIRKVERNILLRR